MSTTLKSIPIVFVFFLILISSCNFMSSIITADKNSTAYIYIFALHRALQAANN